MLRTLPNGAERAPNCTRPGTRGTVESVEAWIFVDFLQVRCKKAVARSMKMYEDVLRIESSDLKHVNTAGYHRLCGTFCCAFLLPCRSTWGFERLPHLAEPEVDKKTPENSKPAVDTRQLTRVLFFLSYVPIMNVPGSPSCAMCASRISVEP